MKNVKNVNYWQIDHRIKQIFERKGAVISPSPTAWEKFKWSRAYFEKKPKEGYFVWIKKQVDFPLTTCITIASPKISQDLTNLLVIEKGITVKANVICNAAKNNLCGTHKARGKLLLKDNTSLEYNHLHRWGKKDFVSPDYEFILGKNSRLVYTYKNLFPPENLQLKTTIRGGKNSSSNLNFIINGLNSRIEVKDTLFLEGKNSQGTIKLKLVGRKNSQLMAKSSIIAKTLGRGHLDCRGLLVDKNSTISLIPELICQSKDAQITHEASIGKISEEELNYLRQRGLSEEEAINLIVTGFLKLGE